MRIAFFTENYFPMVSGLSVSIKTFKDALEEDGHEVYLFAPSYGKDNPSSDGDERTIRIPALPIRIHQTPIIFPATSLKQFLPLILKLDILHVHHPFFLGRIGLFWARALKIPIVYTFHTLYEAYVHYAPLKRELAIAFIKRYVRKFANQVDLVIAPSFSIKEYLEREGVRSPIEVIPTGIRWSEFQGEELPRERVLLFVGRMGEEKNVPFLLRALYRVRDLSWNALFIGDGPDRVRFSEEVKRAGLGDRIAFPGMIPHEEIKELYRRSYVFIFSSLTETQGIVVLEAMASGLPVVALNAVGVNDFVHSGYTGFLVRDEEEFASRLRLLLENEDLHKRMSHTSRAWARLWDISLMASRLSYTYERLKRRFSPPPRIYAIQAFNFI